MITYEFACKDCEVVYEVEQSIKESLPKCCEFCESSDENIFSQVYYPATFFVQKDPNTVQWQAEINTKNLGYSEVQERAAKKKEAVRMAKAAMAAKVGGKVIQDTGEKAAWSKKLDTRKISNIREYVETGKT